MMMATAQSFSTDRLDAFARAWRSSHAASSADLSRLRFALGELRPILTVSEAKRRIPPAVTAKTLVAAIDAIRPHLAARHWSGSELNPWTLAGLKRAEVRNARVLAGLWTPAIAGDAGISFLNAFLGRIAARTSTPLPDLPELRAGYQVRVEDCPIGMASERVDMTIESRDFLIGIEIKIDAGEGPKQLARYVETMHRRANHRGGKRCAVIFLTRTDRPRAGVIAASWRDVAAAARAIVPGRAADRSVNQELLSQFAAHVSTFGKA